MWRLQGLLIATTLVFTTETGALISRISPTAPGGSSSSSSRHAHEDRGLLALVTRRRSRHLELQRLELQYARGWNITESKTPGLFIGSAPPPGDYGHFLACSRGLVRLIASASTGPLLLSALDKIAPIRLSSAQRFTITHDVVQEGPGGQLSVDRPTRVALACACAQRIDAPVALTEHEQENGGDGTVVFVVLETGHMLHFGRFVGGGQLRSGSIEPSDGFFDAWRTRPRVFSAALDLELGVAALNIVRGLSGCADPLILDPCCGMGTFAAAGTLTGVRVRSCDISPSFAEAARENLAYFVPQVLCAQTDLISLDRNDASDRAFDRTEELEKRIDDVHTADALCLPPSLRQNVDGVVANLPWGGNIHTKGECDARGMVQGLVAALPAGLPLVLFVAQNTDLDLPELEVLDRVSLLPGGGKGKQARANNAIDVVVARSMGG